MTGLAGLDRHITGSWGEDLLWEYQQADDMIDLDFDDGQEWEDI